MKNMVNINTTQELYKHSILISYLSTTRYSVLTLYWGDTARNKTCKDDLMIKIKCMKKI